MEIAGRIFFVLLCVLSVQVLSVSGSDPGFTCPEFVEEGSDLVCDCTLPGDVISAVLTWVGQPVTSQLRVDNVSRAQNGTQYTCQMTSGGVTTIAVYTLQVAYGPDNQHINITGTSPFPTNGTGTLTLTCSATEVNPAPSYTWSGVTCDNGNQGNVCQFRPQPIKDDGKRLACVATSTFVGALGVKTGNSIFNVELLYPPTTAPAVTTVDGSDFLRRGDVIKCTVRGGKPHVSSVNFFCSSPPLSDMSDVTDNVTGVTSVISSLTVDTGGAESSTMMCFCLASWQPEELLYTRSTTTVLPIEYKASVKNFTLNGAMTSLTITENDVRTIIVSCSAQGRPTPNITISKMGAEQTVIHPSNTVTSASMTLSDVTCESTGVYVCTVSNGLSSPGQEIVTLNVLCAPKAPNSDSRSENIQNPPSLIREGLSFIVTANPTPDNFTYTPFNVTSKKNVTTVSRGTTGTTAVNGQFRTTCTKTGGVDYSATCVIRPVSVTAADLGVYSVTVSNHLGSYDFYFTVPSEIIGSSSVLPSLGSDDDGVPIAAVAGGAVGGILVVAVVVVVVFLIARKKEKQPDRKLDTNSRLRPRGRLEDEDDFEGHINEAYVSADTLDLADSKTNKPQKTRSAAEISVTSHTYEDVNENATPDVSYASPSELHLASAMKKPDKKRASRVSFKLDHGDDTYASVDDSESREENNFEVKNRAFAGDYAVPDFDTHFDNSKSKLDERGDDSVSGDYAEIGVDTPRQKPTQKPPETFVIEQVVPVEMHAGGIRGPLGDIYSRVKKTPKAPKSDKVTPENATNGVCSEATVNLSPDISNHRLGSNHTEENRDNQTRGSTNVEEQSKGGNAVVNGRNDVPLNERLEVNGVDSEAPENQGLVRVNSDTNLHFDL